MSTATSTLHTYGGLLLGSRLRHISELLYSGVDEIYRAHDVAIPSRLVPLLLLLRDHDGPLSIGELAARTGWSHVAVSKFTRDLTRAGILGEAGHARDQRRVMLHLQPKGRALLERLEPLWRAIVAAVDGMAASPGGLLPSVRAVEEALAATDFAARITAELERQQAPVEIVPFEPRYRDDFKRLNVEWLEKYFYVEQIDVEVLSHPEREILEPGGHIFFARRGDEIVGTCALIRRPRGRYELSKMAVTERHRGLGIGHKLLRAAIAGFEKLDAAQLFLETNHKLTPALRLYEAHGFVRAERPKGPVHYARSDVYMIFSPSSTGASKRRPSRRGSR
ncbi:MAG TPA: bifunctional helix-turn-helix transcriptional regulator/GNAT family N-acetyltransferase [Polyangia bacterium]|nr:bifunctional helix-turn-helix transcriptional regulator/GNAT family N-acetyltransferase [Polyangia bacterium]